MVYLSTFSCDRYKWSCFRPNPMAEHKWDSLGLFHRTYVPGRGLVVIEFLPCRQVDFDAW